MIARLLDQLPGAARARRRGAPRDRWRPGAGHSASSPRSACRAGTLEIERDLGGLPRVAILRQPAPGGVARPPAPERDPAPRPRWPGRPRDGDRRPRAGGVVALPDRHGLRDRRRARHARRDRAALRGEVAPAGQGDRAAARGPRAGGGDRRADAGRAGPRRGVLARRADARGPRRTDRPLPAALTGGELAPGAIPTVGLRVPNHDAPRALARGPRAAADHLREPLGRARGARRRRDRAAARRLPSTSCSTADPPRGGPASTVVDVTSEAPRILRPGAIDEEAISRCLASAGLPGVGR